MSNKFMYNTSVTIIAISVIAVIGMIFSIPVMLLWNGCLVPAISGVSEITWLQAWGLFILFGLLFKNSDVSRK